MTLDSNDVSSEGNTLEYLSARSAPVSRMALVAMVTGVVSVLTFFMLVPGLLALVVGMVAVARIQRDPDRLSGMGFARAGVALSLTSLVLLALAAIFLPSIGHGCRASPRSYCAANMRGILQSMSVYAAENGDVFPIVTYAPLSPGRNAPHGVGVAASKDVTANSLFVFPLRQEGSVTAGPWMLVLRGQVAPKQFICKDDPHMRGPPPVTDSAGNCFDNFADGSNLSYSFAYPWLADGRVAPYWTNNTPDSAQPLMSDMAPEPGTGKPRRVTNPSAAPGDPQTWNSGNHNGDGQNVGFGDIHVEFLRRPNVGPLNDNIFTTSDNPSRGPAEFGGIPATKYSPNLMAEVAPFDGIMYPVRNLDTGRL